MNFPKCGPGTHSRSCWMFMATLDVVQLHFPERRCRCPIQGCPHHDWPTRRSVICSDIYIGSIILYQSDVNVSVCIVGFQLSKTHHEKCHDRDLLRFPLGRWWGTWWACQWLRWLVKPWLMRLWSHSNTQARSSISFHPSILFVLLRFLFFFRSFFSFLTRWVLSRCQSSLHTERPPLFQLSVAPFRTPLLQDSVNASVDRFTPTSTSYISYYFASCSPLSLSHHEVDCFRSFPCERCCGSD